MALLNHLSQKIRPLVYIDYRKLNKKIFKDRYPFPVIEDLLDKFREATIFSTIDLRNDFSMLVLPKTLVSTLLSSPTMANFNSQ